MKPHLSKRHQTTYNAIFRQPIARNLHWCDVRSMLAELGDIVDHEEGHFKTRCRGKTITFHPGGDRTIADADTLMTVRHFLKEVGLDNSEAQQTGMHLLVVIDHREARIYRTEIHGAESQRIAPYDPHGFGRALRDNQANSSGQRKPELSSFYEEVVKTLQGADEILIFGAGTGASNAMLQLLFKLQHDHHDLAERVVGTVVVNKEHMSEDQVLAEARTFYATRQA